MKLRNIVCCNYRLCHTYRKDVMEYFFLEILNLATENINYNCFFFFSRNSLYFEQKHIISFRNIVFIPLTHVFLSYGITICFLYCLNRLKSFCVINDDQGKKKTCRKFCSTVYHSTEEKKKIKV